MCHNTKFWIFLSTLSLRRATKSNKLAGRKLVISIHALLAESDFAAGHLILTARYFYPRSPCGERQIVAFLPCCSTYFYPRSPCGERHRGIALPAHHRQFLSTLSLRRATRQRASESIGTLHFYPRSPCGERHCNPAQKKHHLTISIHALLAESDLILIISQHSAPNISIHALLAESDI